MSMRIALAARRIAAGSGETLEVGDVSVVRSGRSRATSRAPS
jgi:hypothetical protein